MMRLLNKLYGKDGPIWIAPATLFICFLIPGLMVLTPWRQYAVTAAWSVQLTFVTIGFVWISWRRRIKPWICRWLVKQMFPNGARSLSGGTQPVASTSGNLCGAGGQNHPPMTKTWQELFDDWPDRSMRIVANKDNIRAIKEVMFFGYFAPLESWCERNFSSAFYLWSDETAIKLIIPDANDRMLWMLTWNQGLPAPGELDEVMRIVISADYG